MTSAAQVWLVEDGTVERYDGDFNDYKTDLIKEIAAELDEDEEEQAQQAQRKK
jgi:ATP-binding cassette subfamily F protein 1